MATLQTPSLRLVRQTPSAITLAWTDPNQRDKGTEIARAVDTGPFVTIWRASKGILTWSDLFPPAATSRNITVTYKIRAMGPQPGSVSDWSNSIGVIIPATVSPPPPPLIPALTAVVSGTQAHLSWTDPNGGTATSSVERTVATANSTIVGTVLAGATTWTDAALPIGPDPVNVAYRVRAEKAGLASGWSNVATIITPAQVPPPVPPNVGCTTTLTDLLPATINAAIAAAAAGDVICLPAGTQSWTTTVTVNKAISLIGAGIGQTIILDDVPRSSAGAFAPALLINSASAAAWRVSGLQFMAGSVVTDSSVGVRCTGGSHAFRLDHIHIEGLHAGSMLEFTGDLRGVAHDLHIISTAGKFPIQVNHPNWNGETANIGHFSYADASNWGSANFVFVEDSTIETLSSSVTGLDGQAGGRWVMRYSNLNDTIFACHGTESGTTRGMRAVEVYNNVFTINKNWGPSVVVGFRAGTGLVHDNRMAGTNLSSSKYMVQGTPFRSRDQFPNWGTANCSGRGQYDNNLATGIVTGTAGAGSASNSLVDATKNFTTACAGGNCGGTGYSIRNITQNWGSYIQSATATTLTSEASAFGQLHNWTVGDSYEINQVYPCLDQPGTGQTDLLSGLPPTPTGWPNQALEPIYVWANTLGVVQVMSSAMQVVAGRDIVASAPPFAYTPYPYPHPLRT